MNYGIKDKLNELKSLQTGWLDGEGKSLDHQALDRLAHNFAQYYPEDLPLPFVFPTIDGGVQFEWPTWKPTPEIEIDLHTMHGQFTYDDIIVDLNSNEGWNELVHRVSVFALLN